MLFFDTLSSGDVPCREFFTDDKSRLEKYTHRVHTDDCRNLRFPEYNMAQWRGSLLYSLHRRYVFRFFATTRVRPRSLIFFATDLDGRLYENPGYRDFQAYCIWLVGNIPGNDVQKGYQIFSYEPPKKPIPNGTAFLNHHSSLQSLISIFVIWQNYIDIWSSYTTNSTLNLSTSKADSSTN